MPESLSSFLIVYLTNILQFVGDSNYTEVSRNNQGICMPIAAYCYAQIYSPKYWSDVTIDDILDVGNRLYMDSIGTLHMHADQRDLKSCDLHKYAYIRKN